MSQYSPCETAAAITVHARVLDERGKLRSGIYPHAKALCGALVAWDLPGEATPENVRCVPCLVALGFMKGDEVKP